jgi:hypothetical protein
MENGLPGWKENMDFKTPTEYFFYQKGIITTNTPWTRPSYNKLKEFTSYIKQKTDIFERYKIFVYGGCLFDFSKTWDIDLGLKGDASNNEILENDLNLLNDISLKKFNLLLDARWFDEYDSDGSKQYKNIGYIIHQINGDVLIMDKRKPYHNDPEKIKVLTQFLVEGTWPTSYKHSIVHSGNPYRIIKNSFDLELLLITDEDYYIQSTNRGALTYKDLTRNRVSNIIV